MSLALIDEPAPGTVDGHHPWLHGVEWFTEASDRLLHALASGSVVVIGLDHQRDRDPTAGVRVDGPHDQDELDDMPGLRRIERRSPELALHLPARPPFGARIAVTRDDIAVHLRWHLHGQAALLSRRTPHGWRGADLIIMPDRHLAVPDEALDARDPGLLAALDRALGGGRLDAGAAIRSAQRRDTEIHVLMDAGAILRPGSNEA